MQSISFDNQAVQTIPAINDPAVYTKSGFVAPKELEVEQTEVTDKRAVAFVFQVPAGGKKTITVSYTVPRAFDLNRPAFTYKLRVFKQPGTGDDPYALLISYPQQYMFLAGKESNVVDIGGKVSYQTLLSEDKDITLQFTKK